ncbi:hypothetical protein LBMAG53_04950 [Planctomycetota bacterium]|nr:hypothetical protein LBMAG53_04950 [Planctomycetota bacterium]
MIVGLDTDVLVNAETLAHPGHVAARTTIHGIIHRGDLIGLAPQVLPEFLHVATDPRRFDPSLDMMAAIARADAWWRAKETVRLMPDERCGQRLLEWMRDHRLGRKRLLDTMLAATYHGHGVSHICTGNAHDYALFKVFTIIPG